MKKLFEISQDEKQRILEMHETATKKNYLSEQKTNAGSVGLGLTQDNLNYIIKNVKQGTFIFDNSDSVYLIEGSADRPENSFIIIRYKLSLQSQKGNPNVPLGVLFLLSGTGNVATDRGNQMTNMQEYNADEKMAVYDTTSEVLKDFVNSDVAQYRPNLTILQEYVTKWVNESDERKQFVQFMFKDPKVKIPTGPLSPIAQNLKSQYQTQPTNQNQTPTQG